jgi:hypothetical protein
MTDKPAWMEDWACEANEAHARVFSRGGGIVAVRRNEGPGDPEAKDNESRLMLCAAAPALVRALLNSEWYSGTNWDGSCPYSYCPRCDVQDTHREGCELDAALTLAGFPDQPSRDAARERMAKEAKNDSL